MALPTMLGELELTPGRIAREGLAIRAILVNSHSHFAKSWVKMVYGGCPRPVSQREAQLKMLVPKTVVSEERKKATFYGV